MRQAEQPGDRREPVQNAPALHADLRARVVGEAEEQHRPEGDDAGRRPQRLVAAREGNRDIRKAQVQEAIADQREPVHEQGGERRERERLVGRAQVRATPSHQAPAHRQPDTHGEAREHQGSDAGGPARDPEEMRFRRGRQEACLGADHPAIKQGLPWSWL